MYFLFQYPTPASYMPMPTPGGPSSGYNQPQYPPSATYQPPAAAAGYPQGGYGGSSNYPSSYPYAQGQQQQQTPQTQSQPAYNPASTTASNAGELLAVLTILIIPLKLLHIFFPRSHYLAL